MMFGVCRPTCHDSSVMIAALFLARITHNALHILNVIGQVVQYQIGMCHKGHDFFALQPFKAEYVSSV